MPFTLDLFDDKYNGIFAHLNNESKMPCPSAKNFTNNVHNSWKSTTFLTVPPKKSIDDGFSIRHFAGDVFYDTVIEIIYIFFIISIHSHSFFA